VIGIVLISSCAPEVKPPNHPFYQPAQNQNLNGQIRGALNGADPCEGIKIVGPMSAEDFGRLFECLNRNGSLEPLRKIILNDTQNSGLFVKLYNKTFSAKPELRNNTLRIVRDLHDNGGLDDLLSFLSEMIKEFIDNDEFVDQLKPLLEDVLRDDLDLLGVLRAIVNYPESRELFRILRDAFDRNMLADYTIALGEFLRHEDANRVKGAENLVQTTRALFSLTALPNLPFTLEDLDQLNTHHIARSLLEVLYTLQREGKLPKLVKLISDLTVRQTTAVITAERREQLAHRRDELTDKQIVASQQLLALHPTSDLSALIKAASGLNRGFVEDERPGLNQDLLASVDIFLNAVKTVFDNHNNPHNVQGPDAVATKRIITYKIYTNIAHREIIDLAFYKKTPAEKEDIYKNESDPNYNFYTRYIDDFEELKDDHVSSAMNKLLVSEGHAASDAEAMSDKIAELFRFSEPDLETSTLRILKENGHSDENASRIALRLKTLMGSAGLEESFNTFVSFMDETVTSAIRDINKPIFLEFSVYDFLIKLKDVKSIALFIEKALINLDNEFLDKFVDDIIQGLLKKFFEFHKPVDDFMRTQYKPPSRSKAAQTVLSYTISELIWAFEGEYPKKDQITIISTLEAIQVLQRLLVKDNRIQDIREVVVPFISAINNQQQDERILRLLQFVHSGKFTNGHSEAGQLANQLRPTLLQMIDTGFLNTNLVLLAELGKDADPVNRFLSFLTLRKSKRAFIKELNNFATDEDSTELTNQIEYLACTATAPEDIDPLVVEINKLAASEEKRDALATQAQTSLLGEKDERLITAVIETAKRMSLDMPDSLTTFMTHLGNFMTRSRVQQFTTFLDKFDAARHQNPMASSGSTESFLTQLIKRDEIEQFIQIVDQMLTDDIFKDTHLFFSDMIEREELKRTLHLMTSILLHEEEQ